MDFENKNKRTSIMLYSLLMLCLFSFYGCNDEDRIDYQQLFKKILIEEKGSVKSGTSIDDYTSELLLADPYILCDEDGYYAYGTGTNCSYGLEVYYSSDLYTWENCGYVISKDIVDIEGKFWAPEVYKVGNKYLMYFAINNNGSYKIYVAQSDSPRGPFTDISLVRSKAIDPTLYFDDNGDVFIYYCSYSSGGQSICFNKLSDDMKSVIGMETFCFTHSLSWENGITEGPSVFKIDDRMFIAYSAPGYTSQSYSVGLAVFDESENKWVKNKPILSSNGIWFGTGHGSIFKDKNSEMRIVFHAHNTGYEVHPRRSYIGRLYSNGGGVLIGNSFVVPHICYKDK